MPTKKVNRELFCPLLGGKSTTINAQVQIMAFIINSIRKKEPETALALGIGL
jgi:hypothetical protein